MPDFLSAPFTNGSAVSPWYVVARLVVALLLGGVVAWIHARTSRGDHGMSFATTLALLCALVAMATQVIGDNVARAFSLVGALSIVRFRTVVRDTRDTAFVIFSVVVGMAVGAQNLWVAAIGVVVVGAAAIVIARFSRDRGQAQPPWVLRIRVGLGHAFEEALGPTLSDYLAERRVMTVSTSQQGGVLNVIYEGHLREGRTEEGLVKALNGLNGVQDVRFQRSGMETE